MKCEKFLSLLFVVGFCGLLQGSDECDPDVMYEKVTMALNQAKVQLGVPVTVYIDLACNEDDIFLCTHALQSFAAKDENDNVDIKMGLRCDRLIVTATLRDAKPKALSPVCVIN